MKKKPIMIFDGDCGLCRRWIARWREMTGDEVEYAPFQTAAASWPEIPRERFEAAVHLIEPDGRVTAGAEAVFRSLACAGRAWPLRAYEVVPGFASISEIAYRLVATRRAALSRLVRLLGPQSRTRGAR